MKYDIRILVILAMTVGIVFLDGEVARSQDHSVDSVFNQGRRTQNQEVIEDSPLYFPNAEPNAVVAGRWQASWSWQGGGGGTNFWDIVQIRFFFSINSWGGEFGPGITFGPVVVWKFKNADCEPFYVGFMNPEGDFMNGTMRCSDESDTGSWEARYSGPLP